MSDMTPASTTPAKPKRPRPQVMKLTEAAAARITELTAQEALLQADLNRRRAAYDSALQTLGQAEQLRDRAVRSVDRFQHTLNELLAGYRNQRAWQIMLLIRKAYTLLHRRGLR